jgi:peptidoglycan/LPS O-acetylase OafA/YrhL
MSSVSVNALPASVRHTEKKPPIYSAHLDLIRGAAALIVMLGHLRFEFEDLGRKPDPNILSAAQEKLTTLAHPFNYMNPPHQAVILFFVLSGALVGGSVLRDQKRRKFSWVSYCAKRLSRLLTVLLPALLIGGLVDVCTRHIVASGQPGQFGRLGGMEFNLGLKNFLGNLFFLQNLDRTNIPTFGSNAPLWSLSYEFWFYVLFPLLIAFIFAKVLKMRILFLVLLLITGTFLWKGVVIGLILWSFGALATLLPLTIPERAQRAALTAAAALYGGYALFLWKHPFWNLALNDFSLAFAMSILVYVILHRRELHSKTIYTYVTEWIAQMSFTVYLFHFPLVTMMVLFLTLRYPGVMRQHNLAYFGIAGVTYFICYLFYLMFERNTDRVKTFALKLLQPNATTESRAESRA